MTFAPIAFLDPYELAGSLRQKMGLFREGGEDGSRTLPVRGPRATADDPDDDLAFVLYGPAAKLPELKNMLTRIKRLGDTPGGIEFGRIWLELLPSGTVTPWVLDDNAYNARFQRAVMAIRTNPAVIHYSGPASLNLAPGFLNIVNHRQRCAAANHGEWPAIHLWVDFRGKDK